MSFVLGMLSTIPAIILELMAHQFKTLTITGILIDTFFIALAEEFSKFLPLRYYSMYRKSFDEPLDGIVYSVMISMGFATVENLVYVFADEQGNGLHIALMRMMTSIPGHATFAVIMGYYIGKARFDYIHRKSLLFKALAGATLAHGIYDAFLLMDENTWIKQYIPESVTHLLFLAGAIISLFIAIGLSRKLIRMHGLTSQQLYMNTPVLTIRHASVDDIELIRILAQQIWPVTYASILSPQQIRYMMEHMYSETALQKQMEDKHQFIIVYNAGVPIGFASYNETASQVYKLQKIYIHPKQQGRGTGRFVIEQIVLDIVPKGAKSLQLNVNRYNPARSFYEKLGFKVIKEEDIDIGNGFFMNDYAMNLDLGEWKGFMGQGDRH
jgi:ribosomal protein S18 acetylase RimI-like enzyme